MNLMKKTLILTIIALVITLLVSIFIFSLPNNELLSKIPFLKNSFSTGNLSVLSANGVSLIEIDEKYVGETPLELDDLTSGIHKVKLTRKTSSEDSFYDSNFFYVSIEPQTEAIVNVEIAPNGYLSGYVIYYEEAEIENGFGTFSVNGSPSDLNIKLEGESIGVIPYFSDKLQNGEYRIKFHSDQYESIEVPIIIENGFNLNISVYLLPKPLIIEKITNESK